MNPTPERTHFLHARSHERPGQRVYCTRDHLKLTITPNRILLTGLPPLPKRTVHVPHTLGDPTRLAITHEPHRLTLANGEHHLTIQHHPDDRYTIATGDHPFTATIHTTILLDHFNDDLAQARQFALDRIARDHPELTH